MSIKQAAATPYPLQWPSTVPRTPASRRGTPQFAARDWDSALKSLELEVQRLGGRGLVLSTNQPIRKDGMPYAQERRIDDPGVAVYFTLEGLPVCMPCDRWNTITLNVRAVVLHIEAMRGQQRWGVGTARQAFAGYAALPASVEEDWWTVLKMERGTATFEGIHLAHRTLVRSAHPDVPGGSDKAMARLNTARDRALAEVQP